MKLVQVFPNYVGITKKSTDINGFSIWLLKQCEQNSTSIVTSLINASSQSGIFPDINNFYACSSIQKRRFIKIFLL